MKRLAPLRRYTSPRRSASVSSAAGSLPTPGSVSAYEPYIEPSMRPGSQRRFCSSVPARTIGSATSFTYAAMSETVPETFASSSTNAQNETSVSPRPPSSTGTASAKKPSRASVWWMSCGESQRSSISRTRGRISSRTTPRRCSRNARCSSDSRHMVRSSGRGSLRCKLPGMAAPDLRARLGALLRFGVPDEPVGVEVLERSSCDGYVEERVVFAGFQGAVPAFRLVPAGAGPFPGVVAFHQHHSEWHLGKSEVAGRAGDPLQAFGPTLARRGVGVLAPDAAGFEDRRASGPGVEPREGDGPRHHNEMAYRLVRGGLLATTVLGDAAAAVSVLAADPRVAAGAVGALGHSYGGNTTLFLAALDERVACAGASGAACTYRRRMTDGSGIELASIVPGILDVADLDDLAGLIAPRPLLLVSAPDDPYSADADVIAAAIAPRFPPRALRHARFEGGHALTPERFALIVDWVVERSAAATVLR